MSVFMVVVGFGVIALALWDSTSTIVSVEGGGPLTAKLSHGVWRGVSRISRDPRSRAQARGGELISMLAVLLWILLLWLGWTLVFASSPGAVVETTTGEPAGLVDTVYFAGFGLFTLGIGDFRPAPGFFQIATALSSLSGLFLVTVGITYLLSLTSAVADRRGVAAVVSALGLSGPEIVRNAWNGRDFGGLEQQLPPLSSSIAQLAEQHLAKPVLHYFHSPNRHTALEPSLVALFDALLLLRHGVREEVRPRPPTLAATQAACERLFEVYAQVFVRAEAPGPGTPDLRALADAGIPVRTPEEFQRGMRLERRMRQLAASLLEESGWPAEAAEYRG